MFLFGHRISIIRPFWNVCMVTYLNWASRRQCLRQCYRFGWYPIFGVFIHTLGRKYFIWTRHTRETDTIYMYSSIRALTSSSTNWMCSNTELIGVVAQSTAKWLCTIWFKCTRTQAELCRDIAPADQVKRQPPANGRRRNARIPLSLMS